MQRQTQRHNVGVMLTEFQGRSVFRKGAYIHAEKIYRELTVDIVKLIFIFSVAFFQVGLVHFLKVVEIVGAFWVNTLVKDEMLPFFFRHESLATVRAPQEGQEQSSGMSHSLRRETGFILTP